MCFGKKRKSNKIFPMSGTETNELLCSECMCLCVICGVIIA